MTSERPPKTPSKAPKKSTAASGQHPAVKAFRRKLESITEGTDAAAKKLDDELDQFLADLKSSRPPPDDSGDPGGSP